MPTMSTQRPDVNDEDIGMRTFQIRKSKAVERAIEHMRHGFGTQWSSFTEREIKELEWLIGEVWAFSPRAEWDNLRFGSLTSGDAVQLLGFATELRRHSRSDVEILGDAKSLIKTRS
jgi:hypothetical protein